MSDSSVRSATPTRLALSVGLVAGLVAGLLATGAVAPANADAPNPLPVVTADYEISLEPRIGTTDITGVVGPVLDLRIVNPTGTDLRIGFGVDLAVQGVLERLWLDDTWGATESGIADLFQTVVAPGDTFEWTIPDWPGKTYGFYLLSDVQTPGDLGQLVGYSTTSGGFVPFRLDLSPGAESITLGQEAIVAGAGANPELFRGVTANVTASGLTPGENLQLWLAPGLDYFFFYLLGATLPTNAINVGSGTVGPDGVLSATFEIPNNAELTYYQLVVGDPANRYWPAGSYSSFTVTLPSASNSAPTPQGSSVPASLPVGATVVDLLFPNVTTAGATSVAASTTGPVIDTFILTSSPQIYYHIDSTATFSGLAEVCITYNPLTLTGGIPYLYHYKQLGPTSYQWQNITTSRAAGRVCGLTDSFSPFTLGYDPHPEVVLTSKEQCKNGGWATSTLPMFKNQGECVSYFTARDNHGPKEDKGKVVKSKK